MEQETEFDAIVIGSGISGGWAAKELCEKGLKTLVLERGRPVKHGDYPTAMKHPWEFQHRLHMPESYHRENPIATKCYAVDEATEQFFVKDAEHPYVQEKPFDWIRGYQEGGKSLIWARQTQRWSKYEFEGPKKFGYAVEWPINYDDLAPWYSHVEKFVGISGNRDGLDVLPDSESLPPFEMNCVEKHISESIMAKWPDRPVVIGRCAHLTEPKQIHLDQGRGQCQARHLCYRGCPYGAYFSSNSSTLPWAAKTGNLTLYTNKVVESVVYDPTTKRATGVRVIDAQTKKVEVYSAKIIFLNAATLNTNLILLNSRSERFPNGLGNDNGLLGKYLAFHNYRGNISAEYHGFEDQYYFGRRPTQVFIPNFRNLKTKETDFVRGYLMAYSAYRDGNPALATALGSELKTAAQQPGPWKVSLMIQAETIPKVTNQVRLSTDQKDPWGIPQLSISVDYDENDEKILADFFEQGTAMLEAAGCTNIQTNDTHQAPGLDIHEMGGVRMGKDPATSLLNKWNQLHTCENVFVTDGACMTTVGTQNPSLTFMAITARAANYAADQVKAGKL